MTPEDPTNHPSEEFREQELGSDIDVSKVHGSIMREKAEPKDGYEPISLWLITFSFALIFWGGMYLVTHSGGFRADVFNSNLVAWDGSGAAKETGPPDPMVVGKRVFTQNCVVCHQTTGLGQAGQFPPLVDSEWVLSRDWHGDNHLVKIVLNGLQGPITVKGESYNNAMTAFGQTLDDDKIAAVLTYIRNEWENQAPPITPEFVAQIRAENEGRTEAWTQAELQSIERILIDSAPPPAEESDPPPDSETTDASAQGASGA
jgi:mono/diheme cytochrome c family protein